MRDYQTKANVGGAADSITSTKFGAGEFNSLALENESAVSRSGQTLAPANGSGEDTTQLAQSLFLHSVKSASFQAGGTVDAITLTPVSGASGVLLPGDYDNLEGAMISFVPSGANTGAVTVSIGQTGGTQLATKKLLAADGTDLSGGEINDSARIEVYYDPDADSANGAWILTPWSSASSSSELPVGTIYQNSSDSTNPSTLLGYGTWVAIQDRMIIGASGTYAAQSTGGSATTTQTTTTLAAHTHSYTTDLTASGVQPGSGVDVMKQPASETTGSTGAGSAMTTISPYYAAYIWRRTA